MNTPQITDRLPDVVLNHEQQMQVKQVLDQNAEYKQDIEDLKNFVKKIITGLDLADENGNIKPEILNNEKNVFSIIGGLLPKLMVEFVNPMKKASLEKRFSFIKETMPLLEKYAR